MAHLSLLSQCGLVGSPRTVYLRRTFSLAITAMFVVGLGQISSGASGPASYAGSQPFSDPAQVFGVGPDYSGSSALTSRMSPYANYRSNTFPANQYGTTNSAQANQGWQSNTGHCCNPWEFAGSGRSSFSSANGYGAIDGTASPNGYDPRFPTPLTAAPNRALVPVPQDPGAPFDPNASGPGGWSSPGQYGDPNGALAYGGNRGDCTLYIPWASMGYLGGTTPSSTYNQLFVPLLQSHTEMVYADFRGLYNTQSAYVGSFGGGLRTLLRDSVILGGYGFYDYYGSAQHNQFQQVTVGVEMLSWIWEARSNGYIPTSQGSGGSSGTSGTAYLQNGLIFLGGTQQRALSGVDAEFGTLIAADPTAQRELRLFAGGYNFTGSNGSPNIPGVYGRLEARLYDLNFLGQGSRLEFGVISSYDDINNFQVTGMLNVRIAFGSTNCPG